MVGLPAYTVQNVITIHFIVNGEFYVMINLEMCFTNTVQ